MINALSPVAPVLVVDDGSRDETRIRSINAGAFVISKSETEGYDSAITSGIAWSINKGFTHVVSIDADGQIPPKYAVHAHNILSEGAVLAVGTRNKFPRLSELIFAWVSKRYWGVHDPLCGLKAYDLSLLDTKRIKSNYDSVGTVPYGKRKRNLPKKNENQITFERNFLIFL